MSKKTEINSINNDFTQINTAINRNKATVINAQLVDNSGVAKNDILCGKYRIEKKLDVITGEADLYICTYNNEKYIAKIYRRKFAIKNDVANLLKNIDSPYIARLYDTGRVNDYPFEILPYYKKGSIQGKKYSFSNLKQKIIPCINEGLKVLHDKGIIHKDIKPSNLMLGDDNKINIIDFGVSSVTHDGNTVVVTQTGKTPEYSAPETFRELYLAESDYYSLGITIYELFTGTTPYNNINDDEREMYITMQKIPQPKDMPDELYDLILGLTYNDLTNRKDKSNPNRRWTYNEVKAWLSGKKVAVPGIGYGSTKRNMPAYTFNNHQYTDTLSLANALGLNWQLGKKEFYRGILSGFFKSVDPQLSGQIMDLEVKGETEGEDITFFKVLFKLDKSLKTLYWKELNYQGLQDIGKKLHQSLWNNENLNEYTDLLNNNVLSIYSSCINNKDLAKVLNGIEQKLKIANDDNSKEKVLYQLAMILSGDKVFFFEGHKFTEISDLSKYLVTQLDKSYADFENSCKKIISNSGELDIQFEVWLEALGKKEEIKKWKKSLK